MNDAPMLELRDITRRFEKKLDFAGRIAQRLGAPVREEVVHAVDRVNLTVRKGEVVGLVGESGCGKSTLGRMVAGILPPTEGTILRDGRDIKALTGAEARQMKLRTQMIFQDPYASLNPRMRVLDIVGEARASIGTTGGSNAKALTTKDYVDGVGFGSAAQSWQAFTTATRVVNATYTNSTGKPIMVVVTRPDTGGSPAAGFQVNGVTLAYATYDSGGNFGSSILSFIVPTGATYKVVGYASYTYWSELR